MSSIITLCCLTVHLRIANQLFIKQLINYLINSWIFEQQPFTESQPSLRRISTETLLNLLHFTNEEVISLIKESLSNDKKITGQSSLLYFSYSSRVYSV